MSLELNLQEKKHPLPEAEVLYDNLIGIDNQKENLLDFLELILNPEKLNQWKKKHHPKGLQFVEKIDVSSPLIILSGEVGCGKTALANSIATPLGKKLDSRVLSIETPTNLRGSGLVGEISKRITEAFERAVAALNKNNIKQGILIIDEADDLATSRSQMQAHHEDRAGLNALIKQIDKLKEGKIHLAVILITNRLTVLDPAVRRRASLELQFERPNSEQLHKVFEYILEDTNVNDSELANLVEFAMSKSIKYSYSDLIHKVGKKALLDNIRENKKFTAGSILEAMKAVEPSPLLEEGKI